MTMVTERAIPAEVAPARKSDPMTSHRAAQRDPVRRGTDRWRVLVALGERGPMTDFELGEAVQRQQTSAGKRRGELVGLGLVESTGERRPSPSGSSSLVWAITEQGSALLNPGRLF